MYKATTESLHYFDRAANHSTKGSRRGYELLGAGANVATDLKPEERRASLVARWKQLHDTIQKLPKKHPDRIAIGKEMHDLQNEMRTIRHKLRGDRTVVGHFISVARERLPRAVYNAIMTEANDRARSHADIPASVREIFEQRETV